MRDISGYVRKESKKVFRGPNAAKFLAGSEFPIGQKLSPLVLPNVAIPVGLVFVGQFLEFSIQPGKN